MSTLQKIQLGVPGTEENAKLAHADFSFDIIEMIPFPVVYIGNNNRYEYVNKPTWTGAGKQRKCYWKKVDEF
jgi:hypothetical protein